jgi:type VI secretion system protein VasJ
VPVEFEQLKPRAQPWLEPIPGASPAGAAAKFDPVYQAVVGEMAKLDMPAGGGINWKKVAESSGELLKTKTKDLLIAVYLAHALHRTTHLDGLTTGMTLVSEMIERFWDTAFPEVKRIRGRVNAMQWMVEKTVVHLSSAELSTADFPAMEAVEAAGKRLTQVIRERFADQAPAVTPLLEQIERMRLSIEPAAPPPAAESAPPTAAAPSSAPQQSAPSSFAAPPAAPASAADATDYLPKVGAALVNAASLLWRANNADPASYRLLRVGLWLHLSGAPPATGGRTHVPPPAEDLRKQLALIAQNQKWAPLLEESEGALQNHRFALDIHRYSWLALSGLGPSHAAAKDALVVEMRSVLARMPQLSTLAFSDGTPFADPQTRSWIDDQVLPSAGGGSPLAAGPANEEAANRVAQAKKMLAASQVSEALALLQQGVLSARGGRERFVARLELARLAAGAGLGTVAKATYEELDQEATAHGLDAWEPALVTQCLKGLISTARGLSNDPRGTSLDLSVPYKRLCQLDPVAAHEVWP